MWTVRQLCAITINSTARLFPQTDDVKERAGHSPIHMVSKKNKQNRNHFCNHLPESTTLGGEYYMWTVSAAKEPQQQSTELFREAIFTPVLNHSPMAPTELLSIHQAPPPTQTSATKNILKATLPAVPTLFHLSNAYKTVKEAKFSLGVLPYRTPLASLWSH